MTKKGSFQTLHSRIWYKKIITSLFISFAISVFFLFCSELILRVFFPDKVSKIEDPIFRPDKELGLVLKPNIRIHKKGTLFETNTSSFRGMDPLIANPELRIMVYGDSNVMGRFENLEQTFPYKLEKYLKNTIGKKIEVINAGVQGYGPHQYLKRLEREAGKFKPDLVIFVIFADNDFGDIIRDSFYYLTSQGKLVIDPGAYSDMVFQNQTCFRKYLQSLLIVRGAKKAIKIVCEKTHLVKEDQKKYKHEIGWSPAD